MDAKEILDKLSLKEKLSLLTGSGYWTTVSYEDKGLGELFMCDGPLGLRKQDDRANADMMGINNSIKATCFPAAVTLASTWNRDITKMTGKAIAEEAKDQHVGMVLGPGVNIKRNPLCGRNFEYYSEDPILAGELAASFIEGMESQGVASCIKHFACNSQEKDRFTSNGVISERALREIYLRAFETAIKKAHPSALMSSYPKINGEHCSDSKKLLTDILRDEWGFDGMVVTDWGGLNDRIKAIKAGNDLCMPGGSDYMERDVLEALDKGELKEEDIDKCALRVINLALKEAEVLKREYKADYAKHHKTAVKAAEEGIVLLKNDNDILPLAKKEKVLLTGYMAKKARYQGAGSSHVNAIDPKDPLDVFKGTAYAQGCDEYGDTDEELLYEIEEKAVKADTVIVFAGLPERYESEGFDREDMKMPEGHIRMIDKAISTGKKTIVVLMCGSAVECPWADKVSAILYAGLAGEGAAEAIHNIIYGKAAPSGRLAESWPLVYEDVPSSEYYAKTRDALYMEDIYVGYRYYEKAGKKVRWPFGYGLSYTSFRFSRLTVKGNRVSLKVTNTGDSKGKETVQLYISQKRKTLHRPLKELKHFTKIELKPKESKTVEFTLSDEDFEVWHEGYKVIKGTYTIMVGNSSDNILLSKDIQKEGVSLKAPSYQKGSWYETCKGKPSREEWEKLLGYAYVPEEIKKGSFTMDSSIEEMKEHSLIMKIMYKVIKKTIIKRSGGNIDEDSPEFKMVMNSTLGGALRVLMINGGMKGELFPGLLDMANGHYFNGLKRIFRR